MTADEMPFWVSFEPDPRSLLLCVAACVATALVFGLVPAWQTARVDLQSALASSQARAGASRGQRRTLSGLVVAEMALAQVLLVGAALVMLSQREVLRVDPGFRPDKLTFHVALPESGYPDDTARFGFFKPPRPGVYLPMGYFSWPELTLAVHTAADPTSLVPAVRELVSSLDAELPLYRVATMEDEMDRALTLRRLSSWLFGLFALVALVMAAIGTYGVISYGVSQRLREIGIRVALGARRGQVLGNVLRGGLVLAAAGAALGAAGAAALSRSLASLLFGVEARDPAVFAAVMAALVAVALLANAVPALRAARLDAMQVLREE